jgi:hypothetical protein
LIRRGSRYRATSDFTVTKLKRSILFRLRATLFNHCGNHHVAMAIIMSHNKSRNQEQNAALMWIKFAKTEKLKSGVKTALTKLKKQLPLEVVRRFGIPGTLQGINPRNIL